MGQLLHPLSMQETIDIIDYRIHQGEFTQHALINVAKLINMRNDQSLREAVNSCNLINIDGMGVVWGARLCGIDVPERVAGADLFLRLLELAAENGYPVYFLGAHQAVIQKLTYLIQKQYPRLQIAGFHHGYFWNDEAAVVQKIRSSGARLLFIAISSPRKEKFIHRWKDKLGVRFVMGVGGTFDVLAGKTRRAPQWVQQAGLEWFYRLCQEPRRLWKRYLITNTIFFWLLLKERLKSQRKNSINEM